MFSFRNWWFPFLLLLTFVALVGSAPLPHHSELVTLELREDFLSIPTEFVERSLAENDGDDIWERDFNDDDDLLERDMLPLEDTTEIVVKRSIFDKIREGFQKFGNMVKSGFQKAGEGIKKVAQKVGNGIKTAAQKVGQGIKTAAKKVGEGVKKAAQKVGEGVKKAAGAVKNVAQKVGQGIKTAAKKVGEGVKKAAGAVKNVAQKVGNGIKNAAQKVGQGIKTAAQKVGQGVKTAAQKVGKFVKENGAKVAKFGMQVWSTAQSLASKAAKFIPGIGKPISAALDGASKLTGLAADKIPADLGPQLGKGFDVMKKIKNPIGGAAGAVIGALRREELEELLDRYPDLLDDESVLERDIGGDDDLSARYFEEYGSSFVRGLEVDGIKARDIDGVLLERADEIEEIEAREEGASIFKREVDFQL